MTSNYDIESIGLQDQEEQIMIWINIDFIISQVLS